MYSNMTFFFQTLQAFQLLYFLPTPWPKYDQTTAGKSGPPEHLKIL